MEAFVTPAPSRAQRSLSYNDLKRKRLQRSASHKKMTLQQQPLTNKGRNLSEQKSFFKQQFKDQSLVHSTIKVLKGPVGQFRRKHSQKNFISLRQSITDRLQKPNKLNSVQQQKVNHAWTNMEQTAQTKLLIRNLMNKNKSQRRLMRFNQIRDKLKQEKEKSRSNEKPKILIDEVSPLKEKTVIKSVRKQVENGQLYKSTLKAPQNNQAQKQDLQNLLDRLISCPEQAKKQIWQDQFINKQNQMMHSNIIQMSQISQIKKEPSEDKFNESQNALFEKTHNQGSFLKLLHNSKQVKGGMKNREVKRRSQIERLKRIFPQGFFAN